ncbi:MAG: KH domain-containing protein [Simkaniaceae bacterium]|nr:MAG: KH domain-containing protein [Simkaniaceae bacterium]
MKEFVEYIVKNLVDNPDKVNIKEIGSTHTLIIELSVEKADIGKIIGKKGKTINAIRTLLMSVASRNGLRVNLEILEEDGEKSSDETQ